MRHYVRTSKSLYGIFFALTGVRLNLSVLRFTYNILQKTHNIMGENLDKLKQTRLWVKKRRLCK